MYGHSFPPIFFWWWVRSDSQAKYISKCSDFQSRLIETITTSNFYLNIKENNENDMTFCYFSWLSRCCFRHTSSAAHSSSALLFNSRRNLFAEKVQNCNSHFDDLILGCFPFQDGRKIRDRNRVHKCLLGWTPTRFLGYLTAQAV